MLIGTHGDGSITVPCSRHDTEALVTPLERITFEIGAWALVPWRAITFVSQLPRLWRLGRYRWRTAARLWFPATASRLFPKGLRDCGNHEWYNDDGLVERCYHCLAGLRLFEPSSVQLTLPVWQRLSSIPTSSTDARAASGAADEETLEGRWASDG